MKTNVFVIVSMIFEWFRGCLGAVSGVLGRSWGILEPSLVGFGRSWADHLGAWEGVGRSWGSLASRRSILWPLEASRGALEASCGRYDGQGAKYVKIQVFLWF